MSALLLGCLASPGVAAEYPATFQGTTSNGGTVEFDVSADGVTLTRFRATQVPMTCGTSFDATVDGNFPIAGGAFSNGSPTAGLVFGGTFQAPGLAAGTVSYRIVNVHYDGCSSEIVNWTATAPGVPPASPQVTPADSERWPAASLRPRILVSYRQEGGIGGPRPSLIVSKDHRARVSLGQCAASFELNPRVWRRLQAVLSDAQIQTIAGVYPLPEGAADVITYVIRTHAGTVRIAPTSQPANEEVMRQLRPLFKVLNKTVSMGEQRMSPSCESGQ